MDDLDKQLAQLQLLNNRDLSPKTGHGGGGGVSNNSSSITGGLGGGGLIKKVGPAVPPKPNKKPLHQANVSNHNVYSNIKMTLDNPAILEQKLEALEHHKKVLENQQKRRLEQQQKQHQISGGGVNDGISNNVGAAGMSTMFHQKQMAREPSPLKPMIQTARSNIMYNNSGVGGGGGGGGGNHHNQQQQQQHHHHDGGKIYENQNMLYENMKYKENNGSGGIGIVQPPQEYSNMYSNYQQHGATNKSNDGSLIYSNILHKNNGVSNGQSGLTHSFNNLSQYDGSLLPSQEDLPPPPPLDIIPPPLNLIDPEYHTQTSEEDLPPPPSPVSSSYSELRRATDNTYPAMPTYQSNQTYQQLNIQTVGGNNSGGGGGSGGGSNNGINGIAVGSGGGGGNGHRPSDIVGAAVAGSGGPTIGNGGVMIGTVGGGANGIGNIVGPQTYANCYQPDYGTYAPGSQRSYNSDYAYGPSSQGSTTYESIYEPINPRPPSQMSSRSNYSLYTPYVSQGSSVSAMGNINNSGNGGVGGGSGAGGGNNVGNGVGNANNVGGGLPSHKEAEVDILTDLLVQSMDGNQDTDSYGICVQCGERVVGESSGCTAMEQIYHIACFTCCQCQINLQGKPFYALDGKPCCEEDYLNTLEKCSVCMKPILERILRATGKPYHPQCFCCVVCGKSLDGVPFTVDATNQNHCIEDFHKKFAPRCCVCRQPILPDPGKEETVRVVALDRSFHVSCYKCEDCGLLLSSEAEGRGCFPLDDHILCKSCNAKRVQALTSHMTTEL